MTCMHAITCHSRLVVNSFSVYVSVLGEESKSLWTLHKWCFHVPGQGRYCHYVIGILHVTEKLAEPLKEKEYYDEAGKLN